MKPAEVNQKSIKKLKIWTALPRGSMDSFSQCC